MSEPIDPGTFQRAIAELADDNLVLLKEQLTNLLSKLSDTNKELEAEIDGATPEDAQLYTDTIAENKEVIERQKHRMEILVEELQARGLEKREEGVYL